MPETTTGTEPAKLAGKYDNEAALAGGIHEIREKLGMASLARDVPLIGEAGMYKTAAQAESDYRILEVMLGKGVTKEAAKPGGGISKAADLEIKEASPEKMKGIQKVMAKAGLTGQEQALADQWKAKGALTDEHYAAFDKAGRDREEVDAYFAGQASQAAFQEMALSKAVQEAEQVAGGGPQLDNLRLWAKTNIDPARLARLNAQLRTDPAFYPDMIRLIKAEHATKNGYDKTTTLINGQTTPGGAGACTSRKEYREVMRRYEEGDDAAKARILATDQSHIRSWKD